MAEDETDGRGGLISPCEMHRFTGQLGFRDGRLHQQVEVYESRFGGVGDFLRTEWRHVPTIPDDEMVVEEWDA